MKLRRSFTALALTGAVALGGLTVSTAPAEAVTAPVTSYTYVRQQAATCRGIATHIEAMKAALIAYPNSPYNDLTRASIYFERYEYRRLGCERFAPLP